jgi:putative aminopeptidase FrvX
LPAPGQTSSEFGVMLVMADQTDPFDYYLSRKLFELFSEYGIQVRKDVFHYYRSDAVSAVEAGHDVRTPWQPSVSMLPTTAMSASTGMR